MALQNAPRVGIHNKDRVICCVEQDGIRGFRTDAVNTQELLSQLCGGSTEHCRKGAAMFFSEKNHKLLELAGFLPEVAGRTDQAAEASPGSLSITPKPRPISRPHNLQARC